MVHGRIACELSNMLRVLSAQVTTAIAIIFVIWDLESNQGPTVGFTLM